MEFKTTVYAADIRELEKEELFCAVYDMVSEQRQKKTDACRHMADKRRSLAAELLLEKALADLGLCPKQLRFAYGENGKPYLQNEKNVHFNLSHSGDYALCAVSMREVGCDIEKITDRKQTVAKKFSQAEKEWLEAQEDPGEKQKQFFRLWTLKESYVKTTGQGLTLPLDTFCVPFRETWGAWNVGEQKYYFREYDICSGYVCAVCSLQNAFEKTARRVKISQIIAEF